MLKMKSVALLLIIAIFVPNISCNDRILSKFKQNGYKIKDRRTEMVRFNKSIHHFFEIKTFKYNRTTTAHNCTFRPKINLGDKSEVLMQAYKFLSNEYRHFPVRFQVNVKKAYDANIIGIQNMVYGNMTDFIFDKDVTYHIGNFVVDETRFPPLMPNGMYKIEVVFLYLNQEAAVINVFGELYTPMDYPKK